MISVPSRCRFPACAARTSPRGEVAQLVEHTTENRSVDSSILSLATTYKLNLHNHLRRHRSALIRSARDRQRYAVAASEAKRSRVSGYFLTSRISADACSF